MVPIGSPRRKHRKFQDLLFEKAMDSYLEWYKANRGAYTYLKYATPASKALWKPSPTNFPTGRKGKCGKFLQIADLITTLGRRPTVGPQTLDLLIGVRIPTSQL